MKVITYRPLRGTPTADAPGSVLPVEALADTILRTQSLWEAIEALQREGYKNQLGESLLVGISDLLAEIKKLREWLAVRGNTLETIRRNRAALGIEALDDNSPYLPMIDAPPSSEQPMNRASLRARARVMRDKNEDHFLSLRETFLNTDYARKAEELERALRRVYWGFNLESIDESLLEELLGEDQLRNWRAIKNLGAQMVREGYARHGPSGLGLTPHGLQKIARHIVLEIFKPRTSDTLSRRHHASYRSEPPVSFETRPYRFGDPLHLDLSSSVLNAVKRAGVQVPVRLKTEDFTIVDREPLSRSGTVLLIDMSKSMQFENRYIAAKKVALALHEFIRLRYPQDRIAVMCFAMQTKKVRIAELPFLHWDEMNPYTNMELAIDSARKTLQLHRGYRRQIFLITDGEPTAHRERGAVFFQFPPHPKTLQRTLRAVKNLSHQNIALSVFLLSQEKSNLWFVDELARQGCARVFHLSPHDLGQCVLMDYLDKKKKCL